MDADALLTNLNPSQRAAVSSKAQQLAILAGPGSGKTHTLTSRTAWLLVQDDLKPWNIIVATFTVKAAREMKERIGKLIGNGLESKLILGTFHSIARRYLSRYGHLIDIKKDFGIADSADSLAILKRIVKRNGFTIDAKVARSRISGRKARGEHIDQEGGETKKKSVDAQEFESCYEQYEDALQRSNLLDYDDLLLRCVDLLRQHPSCVSNIEAVLIDEFQDTNIVQFDLMRLFAAQQKRITIVGDPDQSIYGFRAAEIKNYGRLRRQYPNTVTIALEDNYRSSGAILLSALSVIEQDSSRVAKSLMPTHPVGTRPVLRKLFNAHREAEWIVTEIQRCKGLSGDLMDLNDFAILLRSASLSRLIESALGKAGIAYRMVGGLRFYDRVEVKTVLDYLRVISQPDNNDAVARVVNVPSRKIGEATVKSLLEEAEVLKMTLWSLILSVVQGKRTIKTKISKQTDQGLSNFVNLILTARKKLADQEQQCSIVELINYLVEKTDYEKWLENHHGGTSKGRWDNVQELVSQAGDFESSIDMGYEDGALPEIEGLEQNQDSDFLSRFLANVALASEVKKDENDTSLIAQVTISTIHAAKGLEWPVVFIPATYEGSIPHSRAEDSNEERRLLYVAMTRAKTMLYMSYPLKNSQGEKSTLSQFLTSPSFAPLLDESGPSFRSLDTISQILRRPLPSQESVLLSSSYLRSMEDDLFPVGDEDTAFDESGSILTRGPQATKAQGFEFGRSNSMIVQGQRTDRKAGYNTTMERVQNLASTTILNNSFVSAGSHLQALQEQPVNCAIEQKSMKMASAKKSTTLVKDNGTLLSFFGKPEAPCLKRPPLDTIESEHQKYNKMGAQTSRRAKDQATSSSAIRESTSLLPSLSNHRITTSQTNARPRQTTYIEEHKRNDYVFLSSSPPRPNLPKPHLEVAPERTAPVSKPAPLPMQRTTLHTTTMAMMQGKKTLGVKRSMNGWKGQAFIPPTMKKSQ